jgi:hypothetical protein
MSCEIIQFSTAARPAPGLAPSGNRALTPWQRRREAKPKLPPATETAKNSRIRLARRDAWWLAGRETDYWRARMDWVDALEIAQKWGVGDSDEYDPPTESRMTLVQRWREAVVKQLLTPAPDMGAVVWKRAQMAGRGFSHLPTSAERVARMIEDDDAFLKAHPARRSNSEAMARKREFNEAMRQRIRDIAAARDLSDEEIKPVLRLKHEEVGRFTEKHGVNLEWLLEGRGRIFKKDPIRLNPNSTGAEFAAVVATLPMADQEAISTMVREIVQERDQ